MRFCIAEAVSFAQATNQLGVTLQDLVQKLAVVDMVASALSLVVSVSRRWWCVHQELGPLDALEVDVFVAPSFGLALV